MENEENVVSVSKFIKYNLLFQLKLYHSVIEEVISGVRDSFLDDGVDEQVLQELKQTWEAKLLSSKAVEQVPEPPSDAQVTPNLCRVTVKQSVNRKNFAGNQDVLEGLYVLT